MKITELMVYEARTNKGGYTKRQIMWAQGYTGSKRWKNALIGLDVPASDWSKFVELGGSKKDRDTPHSKITTPISKTDGWEWKPDPSDISPVKMLSTKKTGKLKKNKGKNKKARKQVSVRDDFLLSEEWRALRYRVLENNDGCCMACGRSRKNDGVVIHVDHIKPRSKHPELALTYSNLQVLCADCNIGKSNKFETDWRPEPPQPQENTTKTNDERLDAQHLFSVSHLLQ